MIRDPTRPPKEKTPGVTPGSSFDPSPVRLYLFVVLSSNCVDATVMSPLAVMV